MKNKEFIFGEKRFVFDKPVKAVPAEGSFMGLDVDTAGGSLESTRLAKEQAAKLAEEQAAAAKQGGTAEVHTETGEKLVKGRSDLDLQQLRSELEKSKPNGLSEFLGLSDLNSLVIVGSMPSTKDLESVKGYLKSEISKSLVGKDLEKIKTLIDVENKDIKEVVANIYANSCFSKLKSEYEAIFTFYEEYMRKNPGAFVEYKIIIESGNIKADFTGDSTFNDELGKFREEEAKKKIDTPEGEASIKAEALKAKAAEFAETPLGKVLSLLGYGKPGTGEDKRTGFEKIISGEDFLGVFIAGIFGYTNYVGESYAGMVDMLPDKYKEKVQAWEKRAKDSKLAAPKGTLAAGPSGAPSKKINTEIFESVMKSKVELPKEGIVLEESYMLGKDGHPESLEVDLSSGGKVILSKEAVANVNGNLSSKGQTYDTNDKKIVFRNEIPKGTIFQGNVVFNTSATEQAAKASGKPKGEVETEDKADQEEEGQAADAGTGTGEAPEES